MPLHLGSAARLDLAGGFRAIGTLALERPVAAHQRDPARASELADPVGADLLDERLDLLLLARDLDHQTDRG